MKAYPKGTTVSIIKDTDFIILEEKLTKLTLTGCVLDVKYNSLPINSGKANEGTMHFIIVFLSAYTPKSDESNSNVIRTRII